MASPDEALNPRSTKPPNPAGTLLAFPKRRFNGHGLFALYVRSVRLTMETTMKSTPVTSRSAFSLDHREWISCSHWGLFPAPERSPKTRGEK
jgi:hypothetical protein